jgi:hypothetical protein
LSKNECFKKCDPPLSEREIRKWRESLRAENIAFMPFPALSLLSLVVHAARLNRKPVKRPNPTKVDNPRQVLYGDYMLALDG